ncbi:MAG: hypothetical protein HQL26_00455 [Candidatus Omnitrophica bacterium]|nr:hypothetical protein [Candidatus Omnitrophota bacterium]
MGEDELAKVRERLSKINEKIKQYSSVKNPQSAKEKPFDSSRYRQGKEISVEKMHAKLRAINQYVRDRALGKDVEYPVREEVEVEEEIEAPVAQPAPVPERRVVQRISNEVVMEKAEAIGEVMDESAVTKPEEATTADLPGTSRVVEAARLGVGLDLGTAYIVSSREVEDKRVFVKNERNAFLSVRCDTATKELLSKLKVKYVALGEKLYVLGTMALELADMFGRETQRSMNMGILNPSESESIPIIKLLVQNILWAPRQPGEICCFSIPAQPIDRDQDTIYHRGVFEGILKSIGFDAMVIDEGYAVVLSEMEKQNFTGIGVSCGAGMVNICAAFQTVPVLSFSITRGGDWIDKNAATVLGIPTTRVSSIKEHGMDLKNLKNREEEAIAIYYRNYIHYLLESMAKVFGDSANTLNFKDPVDIVFAGGSSMVPGFIDVVREEIKSIKFAFALGNVTRADEPFTSVVRGCLFNAINAGNKTNES